MMNTEYIFSWLAILAVVVGFFLCYLRIRAWYESRSWDPGVRR